MNPYFETLEQTAQAYLPTRGLARVRHAYKFAMAAHEGQKRKSGEPYINHPVQVATILAELKQDAYTLAAALLHDTIEDCEGVTRDTIQNEFGDDVANLVEGVTKLGKVYFGSREEAQAENLRKMFLAMAKDLRVVLIKLADRLHNMQTLKHLRSDKQRRIAAETHDIFAPLAHRLGMWSLKWKLDDLAFYYLHPSDFQTIKKLVSSRREEREAYVHDFTTKMAELLNKHHISATVKGRPKHFFSIHKKLLKQNLSYDELYDVLGIRIIVSNVRECYEALGVCHESFKPIQGRFKDYIAMPKTNMYQSLHTAVMGPTGLPVEIQIRTQDMHQIAEFGIAAHWQYKEGKIHTKFDADFSWLRQILEAGQEADTDDFDPNAFLQSLKVDLFDDEVFIFTPKGDVQSLPIGATAIDLAYKIHTEVGHRCIGAKANSQIISLNTPLKNGDRVEILTGNKENPKLDWLNFVQTGQAKNKIRYWFRKQNASLNIEKGKLELEKALLLAGHQPKAVLIEAVITPLLERFNARHIDELYLQIAYTDQPIKPVISFINQQVNQDAPDLDEILAKKLRSRRKKAIPASQIIVKGRDNIEVRIAGCCKPLPGDPIIGFTTLGHGVSVHREDCPHIKRIDDEKKPRLIAVNWGDQITETFALSFDIEALDKTGIVQEILEKFTNVTIRDIQTKRHVSRGVLHIHLKVDVHHIDEFHRLKSHLTSMPDIFTVHRGFR